MKDIRKYLVKQKITNEKNIIEDKILCQAINQKYKPFGLEKNFPQRLLNLCKTPGKFITNASQLITNKILL